MSPVEFTRALYSQVVELNASVTERMMDDELLNVAQPKKLDPRFKKTLDLYASLNEGQKKQFLASLRQAYVDSTSEILGILDGSTAIADWKGDWILLYGGAKLNGSLQDSFLEIDEQKQ